MRTEAVVRLYCWYCFSVPQWLYYNIVERRTDTVYEEFSKTPGRTKLLYREGTLEVGATTVDAGLWRPADYQLSDG